MSDLFIDLCLGLLLTAALAAGAWWARMRAGEDN